ncbi:2Fe-2S iron-sulfur cluster-binding protein [Steroidobacter flavus]|uniref:2Fe-2S iron-sulfur cluster-binding protein n=1 Tax=Steroidobacter flavus TaxID=1842136 RepID=A0ABV8SWK1_9GAMM
MSKVIVIDRNGTEQQVEAVAGSSLMETLRNLDAGVAAICGGICACATCHVFVDEEWYPRLIPPSGDERELLAEVAHCRPTSRLSCQIAFEPELGGLRVTLAPED